MRLWSMAASLMDFAPRTAVVTTFGRLGQGIAPPAQMDDLIADLPQALINAECDEDALGDFAATCMDDRLRVAGTDPRLPNVAGGTLGLLLAARSVVPGYDPQILTADAFMRIVADHGLPVYAHIDQDFQPGGLSGCAFNDKMAAIGENSLRILDDVLGMLGAGMALDYEWARALAGRVAQATRLVPGSTRDGYDEDAFSRLSAVKHAHGHVEVLSGVHRPLAADISFRYGHTLSRTLLDADRAVKVFHLDAWSFSPTASILAHILPRSEAQIRTLTSDDEISRQMSAAMVLTGFSALSLLCGPSTALVIRR